MKFILCTSSATTIYSAVYIFTSATWNNIGVLLLALLVSIVFFTYAVCSLEEQQ